MEGSSRGQPTKCGPTPWGLGEGLTTLHCKKTAFYETLHRASEMDRSLSQDRGHWQALVNTVINVWVL
jgi:hypothetical protein